MHGGSKSDDTGDEDVSMHIDSYAENYAYDEEEHADDDQTLINGSNNKGYMPAMANFVQETGTLEGTTLNEGETGEGGARGDMDATLSAAARRMHDDPAVAHVKQLKYNENRLLLDRTINSTAALLGDLRDSNTSSPLFYPIDQVASNGYDSKLNSTSSKRALLLQERMGSPETDSGEEKVRFDILKLDLKLGMKSSDNLMSSLDDTTISVLLDEKFSHVLRHLKNLKERVDDITSKVLITGDLNSGKSTFCNALLRREILPVDQQPCTNVFCEIINHMENRGVEEVHAVPIGAEYNIKDEKTFNRFPLEKLEDLVYENDKYSLLKVYIDDKRPSSVSLLKNGVVDIRLIDAPGLNLDSYQTMQLFSRQEEIDLVVFVVNAENHFTLSGREFISNVNNDKKFTFIVVNKFDSIKKKDKCIEKIMQQVSDLSPETHKDSEDFVHFVSSSNILKDRGDDDDGGDDGDDDNDDAPRRHPDFDRLEASLRNFILDKRSVSKLLPAKNYLLKVFKETKVLLDLNSERYKTSKEDLDRELDSVKPRYDAIVKTSVRVNEKINEIMDGSADNVYEKTRAVINDTLEGFKTMQVGSGVSLFSIDQFIQSTKLKVVHDILSAIEDSEDYGRLKTMEGIQAIRALGREVLGEDALPAHKFKPESMYSHRKDYALKTQINISFELVDLIDFDSIIGWMRGAERLFSFGGIGSIGSIGNITKLQASDVLSWGVFKTGAWSALFLYGPRIVSLFTGLDSVMRLPKVVPLAGMVVAVGYPLYRVVMEAPRSVHKNIIRKIQHNLTADDYVHKNSVRISKEVRKVLNYPAKDVSVGINTLLERESSLKVSLVNKGKMLKENIQRLHQLRSRVEVQERLVADLELEID